MVRGGIVGDTLQSGTATQLVVFQTPPPTPRDATLLPLSRGRINHMSLIARGYGEL